ncbi:hypothetical protein MVEG_04464 [Podila verticillata NRRL 6337]|nr:hypothetical protein MVEG_04464 [Podila verticillata NRRL 6337]
MNHQRLVRTLISSAPSTNRSLLSIPSLRALSRSFSQKPASTTSTPISTASRPIPSSRPQKQPPQPNRDPEPRFESAYTPIGTSSHHAPINAKSKWDKAADDLIIKLHREDLPWIEIDRRLGRPASSCYNRYYTFLDPNLQAWTLSNGQPNTAMLKRLVYLVEVEKMPYAKIEKQGLLDGLVARRLKSSSANDPTKKKASVINKISMIKKYKDYKILLGRQAFREGQTEVTRAIRRSVELYGENWVKVAASVQAHMDQWHARVATDGSGSSEEKERRPLTPAFAKEIYMAMQEKGVQWGLEDDVIMARKVLELSRRQLNILDILAKKPSSSSSSSTTTTTTTADTSDQDFYWKKISIALGNHSPEQCRRRWQGLWELSDSDKSAQSKMWHRYEKLQFWMLWQHLFPNKFSMGAIPDLDKPLTDLTAELEELSFAKEISRWMRHRSEAQCVKQFSTAVRLGLLPSSSLPASDKSKSKEQPRSRADQVKLKQAKEQEQKAQDQTFLKSGKFPHRKALLDAIQWEVANPTITKLSTVDLDNEVSIRGDPQQQIVRSDWTEARTEALQELVLQEKQGVQRADFELDWSSIARQLETQERAKAREGEAVYISGSHCQKCWEYISGLSTGDKDRYDSSQPSQTSSEWSDLDLKLLQQGVRRFGTSWADIRAQFLPNRDVSELYPKWKSLADKSEGTVDRLQEPDFVGLLSALDKVGKEKSK